MALGTRALLDDAHLPGRDTGVRQEGCRGIRLLGRDDGDETDAEVPRALGVVADLCDRVTVMQNGLFVEQGPVRAIFNDARHPYTKTLLDAILDEGPARGPLTPATNGAGA